MFCQTLFGQHDYHEIFEIRKEMIFWDGYGDPRICDCYMPVLMCTKCNKYKASIISMPYGLKLGSLSKKEITFLLSENYK